MLLEKKRILVTGVLNDASMAFAAARVAQEQGAEVVLSSFGRVMRITERTARRLPTPDVQIVELDVQSKEDLDTLAERVGGQLHGVVHSIGFAPASCLGGGFLDAPWEDVAIAMQTSAYSLKALAVAVLPLMSEGGAIVGLDFDNDDAAWPFYDWMGVSKAAFESVARYLARDLGPKGDPRQPRRRRPDPVGGRQEHPRVRELRRGVGRPSAARLGRQGHRAGRSRGHGVVVRLLPGDHRRDRPRRRRFPRRRRLIRFRGTVRAANEVVEFLAGDQSDHHVRRRASSALNW